MTAYAGRNFTLSRGTGGGAVVITQCRTLSFTVNHQPVEITNKDSAGWQTFLENAGTKGAQIQFEGLVDNTAVFESFHSDCQTGTIASYRLVYGDGDVLEGAFHPANLQVSGGFDNEQTFTATLNSSGALTFTNAQSKRESSSMATYTVQDLDIGTGLTPTFAAVAASDEYANEGRTYLHVKNGGGSTVTITVTAQQAAVDAPQFGRIVPANRTWTVAVGAERIVPFHAPSLYNSSNNRVVVGYSATASVTAAAIRCPAPQ